MQPNTYVNELAYAHTHTHTHTCVLYTRFHEQHPACCIFLCKLTRVMRQHAHCRVSPCANWSELYADKGTVMYRPVRTEVNCMPTRALIYHPVQTEVNCMPTSTLSCIASCEWNWTDHATRSLTACLGKPSVTKPGS